jgi:hypothetical protein
MATETESMLNEKEVVEQWLPIPSSSRLHELYEFRGTNHINDYLQSHSELINFLLESHYHFEKYFGTSAKFELEVVHDPEAQHEQLIVYINTSLPVDEALIRLDQFDNDWFLDHIDWLNHLINFSLEIA